MHRFLDAYYGWLKENKIIYTSLLSIGALGSLFEIPEISILFNSTIPSLSWLPIILIAIPFIAFFAVLPAGYYHIKYNVQITINWLQCTHQGRNHLQTVVLAEDSPSTLEIMLELGPSIQHWALKLKVSKGCKIIELKEIRNEYNPQISDDEQSAWFYDQELEKNIRATFLLQATGDGSSSNIIIELEKLANNKLEKILNKKKSLKNVIFESFWKDRGIVIGSG
ncbi:MAG: hypothetical protein ACTSWQ_02680 [Candidatus Thorarchaeota archaeon]